MTPKQAKKLSLIKWEWILKNPQYDVMYGNYPPPFNKKVGTKYYLDYMPQELKEQIKDCSSECGLCEYFLELREGTCADCILTPKCTHENGYFTRFQHARTIGTRKKYAQLIVDAIKAWEV